MPLIQYSLVILEGLVERIPSLDESVVSRPCAQNPEQELQILIPSVHSAIEDPFTISTFSGQVAAISQTEVAWNCWAYDALFVDITMEEHLDELATSIDGLISEKFAIYKGFRNGIHVCGGGFSPPNAEPVPVSAVDRIEVTSWLGTYDQVLTGAWTGWPNDPSDPFYTK